MPQIAGLAKGAGFTGDDLVVAVAVARAESGGDTEAYNPETAAGTPAGRGSYGLWQVYRVAHPEFDAVDLYDPAENARAAYKVYSSARGFRPWSTYQNGLHLRFMEEARAAVANPESLAGLGVGFAVVAAIGGGVVLGWYLIKRYLTRR